MKNIRPMRQIRTFCAFLLTILLTACSAVSQFYPILAPTPSQMRVTPSFTATASPTSTPTGRLLTSPSPSVPVTVSPSPTPLVRPPDNPQNPVFLENKKPGTDKWQISDTSHLGEITGFSDQDSVNLGQTISFAVSVQKAGLLYQMDIYRLGWYAGKGARLLLSVPDLVGEAQGYWTKTTNGIIGCLTCTADPKTGLVDTHWKYTYSLIIPYDWVSGDYLVKLTGDNGAEGYINFIVRDDARTSDLLAQIAVNTYQAYNDWGGYSLYLFPPVGQISGYGAQEAVKVSFNRPMADLDPFKIFYDIQAIHFLERLGYDVSYTTSVEIDQSAASLSGHKAFISIGHDEYWTRAMRDHVEQARDSGVSLAFWGGNDVYSQARLEPDQAGQARRVLVEYREAARDPVLASNPAEITVPYIDPFLNRPQNSLTGTIFGGIIEQPPGVPWVVAANAPKQLLEETGLAPGQSVPALAGKECDSIADNGFQPPDLQIVAASPMLTKDGVHIFCHTTFYRAPSGAFVFNAGTLSWTMALDDFGHHNPGLTADARIQRLNQNVLALFGTQPARLSP